MIELVLRYDSAEKARLAARAFEKFRTAVTEKCLHIFMPPSQLAAAYLRGDFTLASVERHCESAEAELRFITDGAVLVLTTGYAPRVLEYICAVALSAYELGQCDAAKEVKECSEKGW